ncbi:MAG: CDP-alcohol phosphatidyltransferase family protein [Alphaproteobacteria bacterium]
MEAPAGTVSVHHDSSLLGLTLLRRAELAARRSGYAKTILLRSDREADREWGDLTQHEGQRLVVAPVQAVAEVAWLKAAATVAIPDGGWGGMPGCVAILDSLTLLEGFAPADATSGFDALERHLTGRFGSPTTGLDGWDVVVIRDHRDLSIARRRLLRALVKETDGFMARHVERPISIAISRWLAETPMTPNQVTIVSTAVGIAGAPFFLSASPLLQTVGALLFLTHSILDGCDGELARLKFQESRWGGLLDFWSDNIVHLSIFSCMALGWAQAEGALWPLLLGAAAVLGAGGSAGFVYWRLLRDKGGDGPIFTSVSAKQPEMLSRCLDGAARRDFIYLVLILALFGKASWFLALTGIGAPIYLILLLIVAFRDRQRSPAIP